MELDLKKVRLLTSATTVCLNFMRRSRFQNLVAAEVTRLKHSEDQSLLTSAATVLKEPRSVKFSG